MSSSYHIDDELQQKGYDRRLMGRLLVYVRPYAWVLLAATLLLLLATILTSLIPWLNMIAIDQYINSAPRAALEAQAAQGINVSAELSHAIEREEQGLSRLVAVMAGLMLVQTLLNYMQMLLVTYVGQTTMLTMRTEIFAHLQRMSLRFLDKNPVGRLMTRVTTDVEHIQESIVAGLVDVVSQLFTILIVLFLMVILNWRLTLVALSTLPFMFVCSYLFRKAARRSYLAIRMKIAVLNAYMQEHVNGIRVAQIFGCEDRCYDEFDRLNGQHRDEWHIQVSNYARYFPTVEFLGTLSVALIFLFGGRQILASMPVEPLVSVRFLPEALSSLSDFAAVASIGMLLAYVQWVERLFEPIRHLADQYNLLQAAMASSERIFELLDTPEGIENKKNALECQNARGAIEFKNVWFSYDGNDADGGDVEQDRWVLKNVSFSVAPGERVAIVGHTGAGKTTLTSLLSRLYDVQRGAITVDGVDVRDYEKTSLRRNIGIVLQDVFLFSGTVAHNIRLGNEALDQSQVEACASYVNAAKFIERLPEKYDYDIGERGCNLSTGQRQLLAFARTLAHDPRILVLDEATSSIDTESEELIRDAIGKLMDGRTSIVIAHRLSTVQHADRIIVMHHGEIREMGTHQQLLAERGLYYRLYQLQYKDQNSRHEQ